MTTLRDAGLSLSERFRREPWFVAVGETREGNDECLVIYVTRVEPAVEQLGLWEDFRLLVRRTGRPTPGPAPRDAG